MDSIRNLYTQLRIDIASSFLLNHEAEKLIYDQIAAEMSARDLQPSLMTKAYAEADGNEEKARSLYIKYRFNEIRAELLILHRQQKLKKQQIEEAAKRKQIQDKKTAKQKQKQQVNKDMGKIPDPEFGVFATGIIYYVSAVIVIYLGWWLIYANGDTSHEPSITTLVLIPIGILFLIFKGLFLYIEELFLYVASII